MKVNKFTQTELAVLFIADACGTWIFAYQLCQGPFIRQQKLGSQGDTRMNHLFPDNTIDSIEVEVKGTTYAIERAFEGKYRKYRLTGIKQEPHYEYQEVEENGERFMRKVLVSTTNVKE